MEDCLLKVHYFIFFSVGRGFLEDCLWALFQQEIFEKHFPFLERIARPEDFEEEWNYSVQEDNSKKFLWDWSLTEKKIKFGIKDWNYQLEEDNFKEIPVILKQDSQEIFEDNDLDQIQLKLSSIKS